MAIEGKGKQGGARVICLYFPGQRLIFFFHAYTKAKTKNLFPEQTRRLRAAVIALKEHFHHEIDRNRI